MSATLATALRASTSIRDLFGIPISALTMAEALTEVDRAIERRGRLLIGVVNAAKVVNMRRDSEFRHAVMSSDLILADGFSIVCASRMLGRSVPERVAGIDLMNAMLQRGHERGYRVFCLGATDDVLAAAELAIMRRYPGVHVAGRQNGYFTPEEEPQLATAIRNSKAEILFVAMTSPKKERFLARWGPDLGVPVCHGVGGSFDILAGKVRRAPEVWQRLGFEWLYRVLQEPRRLWKRYLVTNSVFVGLLLTELCREAPARLVGALSVRRKP